MQTIINILLLIIIVYSSSVIPINTSVFNINLSEIMARGKVVEIGETSPDVKYSLQYRGTITSFVNPDIAEFELKSPSFTKEFASNPNFIDDLLKNIDVSVDIVDYPIIDGDSNGIDANFKNQNAKISKHLTKDNISIQLQNLHDRIIISVPINSESVGLDTGNYQVIIRLEAYGDEVTQNLSVFYANSNLTAISSEQKNNSMLCYFNDKISKMQIPMHVPRKAGNNEYRSVIYSMMGYPQIPGTDIDKSMPDPNRIWYSAGVLDLYYSKSNLEKLEGRRLSDETKKSIAKTFEAIKGVNVVNQIRFFDYPDAPGEFEARELDRTALVYLPLRTSGTNDLIWINTHFGESDDINENSKFIFSYYKYGNQFVAPEVVPIVPSDLILKDTSIVGSTVKINLASEGLTEWTKYDNYINLLIESMRLSYTTIKGIDSVEIFIDGNRVNKIGNVKFEYPLNRPDRFN